MFDQHTAARIVTDEYERLVTAIATCPPDTAVLDGWTITDLAAHCDTAIEQQAEAFHRGLAGRSDPPALNPTPKSSDERLASLRRGTRALAGVIGSLAAEQIGGLTPLPFGVVPTTVAIQIAALEAGFHAYDAAIAVDADTILATGVAETLLDMIPGLAPMLAAGTWGTPNAPTTALAYQLAATSRTIALTHDGATWHVDTGGAVAAAGTVIAGDDDAIALFFMGRRSLDHPSLTVTGDHAQADAFKRHFPGP